jgi:hypothetical protein
MGRLRQEIYIYGKAETVYMYIYMYTYMYIHWNAETGEHIDQEGELY